MSYSISERTRSGARAVNAKQTALSSDAATSSSKTAIHPACSAVAPRPAPARVAPDITKQARQPRSRAGQFRPDITRGGYAHQHQRSVDEESAGGNGADRWPVCCRRVRTTSRAIAAASSSIYAVITGPRRPCELTSEIQPALNPPASPASSKIPTIQPAGHSRHSAVRNQERGRPGEQIHSDDIEEQVADGNRPDKADS